MGRSTGSSEEPLNRGAWSAQEDKILREYITVHGGGKWNKLPQRAGLKRCGKSCRLRWLNYLRPNIKRGNISQEEEDLIIRLHKLLGNRWSLIAGRIPGRTDNEIKNYWNTNLAKRVIRDGHNNTSTTVSATHQEKANVFHAKASKCSKLSFIDHPLPHYSSMQLQREFTNEMEMEMEMEMDHSNNNELLSFPCGEFVGGGRELSSTDHLLFDFDEDFGEVCLSDLLNLDFSDTCDLGYNNNNNNNNNNNSSDQDLLTLWDKPTQSNLCDETNVANDVHSSTSLL